ncbi:hypothetical protein MLD38_015649 [Melastoma candidum]|uniref:Uncharacterized protein n=1 Tax=Melastoma candidum TaxID=119954 RepID=A0ACB9RG30_9MYRT|nr:hypothetical protein MLD38_015649 [Melastoma candidum]
MSFAAYKMMHLPTGIEHCASGYITHSPPPPPRGDPSPPKFDCHHRQRPRSLRRQGPGGCPQGWCFWRFPPFLAFPKDGLMDGVSGVSLDLVCHYRSMHCFEGPNWLHLKRGRECFAVGPYVKVDPQGRCDGVLVYNSQMIVLKAAQAGSGLVGDEDSFVAGITLNTRVEQFYIINLRDLDTKHVKDFVFVHGYIEPVTVAFMSWNLPGQDAMHGSITLGMASCINLHVGLHLINKSKDPTPKLLRDGIPIQVRPHALSLALNHFATSAEGSQEMPESSFSVELDGASSVWLLDDVALLSTETGDLLLLSLVYYRRIVQKLDLSKSKASILTSTSLFYVRGSQLWGLHCYSWEVGLGIVYSRNTRVRFMKFVESREMCSETLKWMPLHQKGYDGPHLMLCKIWLAARICHFMAQQLAIWSPRRLFKTFSFSMRDSFLNVGPLKDFAYGLRMNSGANAMGIAKQTTMNWSAAQVKLPGCRGIWTVFHKNSWSSDSAKFVVDDEEYHAYLIISMENRAMVLETGELLAEVTESVDIMYKAEQLLLAISLEAPNPEPGSEKCLVSTVSIADPYVLLKMSDDSIRLLGVDPLTCTISVVTPASFHRSNYSVSSCTLYHDKGLEAWLRKARMDAWLNTGVDGSGDGVDGVPQEQGDTYCRLGSWLSEIACECTHSYVMGQSLHSLSFTMSIVVMGDICDISGYIENLQLSSVSSYDNYWPVQKVPLKGTPHQVTYFAERNLYSVIVSVPVQRPLNRALSSLVDQEVTHQFENQSLSADGVHQTYTVEEFEVRILEQEKSGGPWLTRATIPMQNSENALTVRVVMLFNTTTRENETVLAVGTAYVQGDDVAVRGCILLFSVAKMLTILKLWPRKCTQRN